MKYDLTNPCIVCPFLQKSLEGWLGGMSPVEFATGALSEGGVACHHDLEELREHWDADIYEEGLDPSMVQDLIDHDVQQCVGALMFASLNCKSYRNPKLELQRVKVGKHTAIMGYNEFITHHSSRPHRKKRTKVPLDK